MTKNTIKTLIENFYYQENTDVNEDETLNDNDETIFDKINIFYRKLNEQNKTLKGESLYRVIQQYCYHDNKSKIIANKIERLVDKKESNLKLIKQIIADNINNDNDIIESFNKDYVKIFTKKEIETMFEKYNRFLTEDGFSTSVYLGKMKNLMSMFFNITSATWSSIKNNILAGKNHSHEDFDDIKFFTHELLLDFIFESLLEDLIKYDFKL